MTQVESTVLQKVTNREYLFYRASKAFDRLTKYPVRKGMLYIYFKCDIGASWSSNMLYLFLVTRKTRLYSFKMCDLIYTRRRRSIYNAGGSLYTVFVDPKDNARIPPLPINFHVSSWRFVISFIIPSRMMGWRWWAVAQSTLGTKFQPLGLASTHQGGRSEHHISQQMCLMFPITRLVLFSWLGVRNLHRILRRA